MNTKQIYQRPEILALGAAETITLGDPLQPFSDNCGCRQKTSASDQPDSGL
jgi:hypothetical protein